MRVCGQVKGGKVCNMQCVICNVHVEMPCVELDVYVRHEWTATNEILHAQPFCTHRQVALPFSSVGHHLGKLIRKK